ncbi:Hypothetical predicted protein, partial [Mytilus galloprovincialis]
MSSRLILLTAAFCTGQCLLVRETVFGNVRGKISTRVPERQVEEYLGIPYASPPIGHLRFKRPQDPTTWKPSVLETNELPPACPQPYISYIDFHKPGTTRVSAIPEDCRPGTSYVYRDEEQNAINKLIEGGAVHEYLSTYRPVVKGTSSKLFNDKDTECGLLFLQKSTLLFEQQLSETNIFVDIEEIVEKDTYYDTNSTIEMLAFAFLERQEFKDGIKEELKKWKTLDLSRYPESVVMYSDVYFFAPMMKLADMISQKKNVYTLSFEYISQSKSGPDWI